MLFKYIYDFYFKILVHFEIKYFYLKILTIFFYDFIFVLYLISVQINYKIIKNNIFIIIYLFLPIYLRNFSNIFLFRVDILFVDIYLYLSIFSSDNISYLYIVSTFFDIRYINDISQYFHHCSHLYHLLHTCLVY